MTSARLGIVAAAVAAAITVVPCRAGAYIQYRTKSGVPYKWCDASVTMTAYVPQAIAELSTSDMYGAAAASLATWDESHVTCPSGLNTKLNKSTQTPPRAVLDHQNSLIFRNTSWDWQGPPPGDGGTDPDLLYDPQALALTTLFVLANGQILDSDIEVNAVNFDWVWSDQPPVGTQDLQNTLTHEVGHVVGLDHSCWTGAGKQPLDQSGNPAPPCSDLPASFEMTTMFPSANPQDTSKRVLGGDEVMAVCAIYPRGAPSTCPGDGCSCRLTAATAEAAGPDQIWLAAGVVMALAAVRRRRRAHSC